LIYQCNLTPITTVYHTIQIQTITTKPQLPLKYFYKITYTYLSSSFIFIKKQDKLSTFILKMGIALKKILNFNESEPMLLNKEVKYIC